MIVVHSILRLFDDGVSADYRAELIYDPAEPFAVKLLTFEAPDCLPVVWVFARDLLAEGLQGIAGLGDLVIWPDGDSVMFRFQGEDRDSGEFEWMTGQMSRRSVRHFLVKSYDLVPVGRESRRLNIDAELVTLFSQAGGTGGAP